MVSSGELSSKHSSSDSKCSIKFRLPSNFSNWISFRKQSQELRDILKDVPMQPTDLYKMQAYAFLTENICLSLEDTVAPCRVSLSHLNLRKSYALALQHEIVFSCVFDKKHNDDYNNACSNSEILPAFFKQFDNCFRNVFGRALPINEDTLVYEKIVPQNRRVHFQAIFELGEISCPMKIDWIITAPFAAVISAKHHMKNSSAKNNFVLKTPLADLHSKMALVRDLFLQQRLLHRDLWFPGEAEIFQDYNVIGEKCFLNEMKIFPTLESLHRYYKQRYKTCPKPLAKIRSSALNPSRGKDMIIFHTFLFLFFFFDYFAKKITNGDNKGSGRKKNTQMKKLIILLEHFWKNC